MKVLVVEDEWMVRETIAEELSERGFDVIEAGTGEEALTQCSRIHPDVLLTDIRLPGKLTGWDIAECCGQHEPGLPVIYVTGFSHVDARMVPGSVFLTKPYRAAEIVSTIRRLIG